MYQQVPISRLTPHPANEEIYGVEDVSELADKIKENKWIKSLVITPEYRIISGHRRYIAAQKLGYKELPCETRKFKSEFDELEALLLENEYRDKTNIQRVNEAERWEVIEREKAKMRFGGRHKEPTVENIPQLKEGKSRDIVAKKVGFGNGKTYETAKKVKATHDKLKEEGREEDAKLIATVLDRNVSGAQKISEVIDIMPEETKQKLVKQEISVPKAIKSIEAKKRIETLREEEARKTELFKQEAKTPPIIKNVDCVDLLDQYDDNSIDLLLTDPPYSTDVEDIFAFVKYWLPTAIRKVKKSGRLYICTGAYPEEMCAYLNELLFQEKFIVDTPLIWTYRNTIGPATKKKYKLNYQLVWHLYSEESQDLNTDLLNELFSVKDINAPDGRMGNRYHAWQKPDELAELLIRHSTKEGDLVVDPFACTGTFLINAVKMNRKGEGSDISEENLNIAQQRGCEIILKEI